MAKLGSTVDARLSRISPYAIRAIEMGGAARGAGYAALGTGLGKAITSVMHQTEESRIDEILNEALMPREDMGHQPYTPVLDSKGKATTYSQLDEKAIRRFLSDKKVFGRNISEKRIASFLKQERDAIDSNNTTQLAFDTFEANQEEIEANQLFRQSQADLALSRHGELLAKAEQAYQLELKRYDEVIADKAATAAEKALAAKNKLEAEQKTKTNRAILKSIVKQMDEKDEFGNPFLSAESYLNLADQMEKMVLEGEIIDEGLIITAGGRVIEGRRIGYDMQKLATADDVGPDAGETIEEQRLFADNALESAMNSNPELAKIYDFYSKLQTDEARLDFLNKSYPKEGQTIAGGNADFVAAMDTIIPLLRGSENIVNPTEQATQEMLRQQNIQKNIESEKAFYGDHWRPTDLFRRN